FEEQNIEFIQFWVMDPYVDNPNHEGGDLYFNLGSVSEDILRDDRQAFENGIDLNADLTKMDSTIWGFVPKIQPITEFFDNDPSTRPVQDVGYDGINDLNERRWEYDGITPYTNRIDNLYGQNSAAYINANQDPSGDNFRYYLGPEQDNADANILERYKEYNGPQGNSSLATVDGFTASSSNVPDKEDANRDQTLNKTESYYQYKVSFRKEDLTIGQNYVTDVQEGTIPANQSPDGVARDYRWVQFKVPIFLPDKAVGPISDFRSIRFMRMFLKDFEEEIVLRFARLDLIRGEWRRYRFSLDDVQEEVPIDENDETVFAVNAVNLEENANRKPVPYVLPPGIQRQTVFGTSSLIQENEQSMSLYACNLKDGDARAVFKNIQMDMRMYKRMKMFIHAEDGTDGFSLNDKDLNLFIRIGSDYNQNYYEFEVPLKVTPWGTTSEQQDVIWPAANQLDIPLDGFKDVKLTRDRLDFPRQIRYTEMLAGGFMTVIGYPNLSNIRTMMIGIRNPKKESAADPDDGQPKCAEVWVNELRLTDFDQRGGWAANARVTAKLADFADVSVSADMSTIGFGAIDQTVNERNKFEAFSYDFQSKWNLDKFFGQKSGVRIPMFFSYSEGWKNPQFNPLDPDIEFKDALNNLENEQQKTELKHAAQDYTRRKNINFTNVRKERKQGSKRKPQFYDIENFSVSYSFSEQVRRDINTKKNDRKDHKGTLNYNYQGRPKNIQPFKKVKSKYLIWVRDFNFYYAPNKFTFRTDINRTDGVLQMRNTDNPQINLPQTFNKSFTWDRVYDFGYDLTKAIKIDYNARMETRIDEPANGEDNSEIIWNNFKSFGRPTKYHQTTNVNWQLPINKFPFLDFVTSSIRYSGDYDWQTNSLLALDPTKEDLYFGNTIQNNASVQLNGNLNFVTLYNNVPYLKRVNQGRKAGGRRGPQRPQSRVEQNGEQNGDQADDKKKKKEGGNKFVDATVRFLMMVRSASVSYTRNEGTALPGFIIEPVFMGTNPTYNNAPGWGFVLGSQADITAKAASNNWLTPNPNQPNRYMKTLTENLNIRATVEPFRDFRIDVTATRIAGVNSSSIYRQDENYDPNDPIWNEGDYTNGFRHYNPMVQGNYSISFWSFGSAFEKNNAPNYDSKVYQQFREYRDVISNRLATDLENNSSWYTKEYLDTSIVNQGYQGFSYVAQDVMIPAFLAAYGGYDPNKVRLDAMPTIPMPNWRLNYSGLMKLETFRKKFNSFTVSHSYKSLYTMSTFQTNLQRQQAQQDLPGEPEKWVNDNGDFLPENQIATVSMSENFSPLIGFNMRMKNNTSFKLEMNRNRMVSLSMANNIISETKGSEIVIGAGYIIRDVKFNLVRTGANKKAVVSNLELKADLSIRDNQTVMRRVLEEITQVTAGQRIVTIKVSADYQLSRRVSTRIFYDQVISTFKTSNAFPTNNIYAGLSFRLNLAP
ncbi:MAG: cell surface protein SprA, partial [Schleiferiaceae bacterium]|nr:cell surface protein SprA [Schleiferiaceae bacterium]